MSKGRWSLPGYQGRPSSAKVANMFMLVLISILIIGFIKAGIREGWFDFILG